MDKELERIITLVSIHVTRDVFEMVVDTVKELPIPEELKADVLDKIMEILRDTTLDYLSKTTSCLIDVPAERTIQ